MHATAHTLLVVDDNEENREMLSRRLERKGFAVRVASEGREALELLRSERVSLAHLPTAEFTRLDDTAHNASEPDSEG
jgi:CheY-like chemotaxis protein